MIRSILWLWGCLAIGILVQASSRSFAQELSPDWSPKLAVTEDGETAYIAQFTRGKLLRLKAADVERGADALEEIAVLSAGDVLDMQICRATNELLLACDRPSRLLRYSLTNGEQNAVALPARPARIALSSESDGRQKLCVSMPTINSVWLNELGKSDESEGIRVPLSFSPKEVLAFGESLFVVADAVGNRVSIVDAQSRRQTKTFTVNGYHIAGLALDPSASSLLVTHQVLSSNARTETDDIRWGNLIQNNISSVPLPKLAQRTTRLSTDTVYRLGDFGHGSADPAGVVALGERLAVALAGTDEVALYSKPNRQPKFVQVGHVPERLTKFGGDRVLCVHRLDSRIAVINCQGDAPQLERMLGSERVITTAQQRGELAFYSGLVSHEGWMSCNSCHIEGSTPDLLADTLGDGTYDTPKKIPSLVNVARTGPWAWHGGHHSLQDQIAKTLSSTMHTPESFPATASLSRESLVEDLFTYLSTLPTQSTVRANSPENNEDDLQRAGEALFQQHCARCHDPEQHFTSNRSYDVGLNDERGQKLFNPPSLIDLSNRKRYMHDGRFSSLEQVLKSHPIPATNLSLEEQEHLRKYLESL